MWKCENWFATKLQCVEKDIFIADICDVFEFNQAIILCNFGVENTDVNFRCGNAKMGSERNCNAQRKIYLLLMFVIQKYLAQS